MTNSYRNYFDLSETLSTSTLYDKNKNDFLGVAEEQSNLLKDLAYANKKRVNEGNEMADQIQV